VSAAGGQSCIRRSGLRPLVSLKAGSTQKKGSSRSRRAFHAYPLSRKFSRRWRNYYISNSPTTPNIRNEAIEAICFRVKKNFTSRSSWLAPVWPAIHFEGLHGEKCRQGERGIIREGCVGVWNFHRPEKGVKVEIFEALEVHKTVCRVCDILIARHISFEENRCTSSLVPSCERLFRNSIRYLS